LISFARAVIGNPRIIILDEATANIDTQTELLIQRALQRVLEGRTSIVIAHRLSTVRNANKIIVLSQGRLVEMGTHEELLGVGGVYERLYAVNYGLVSEPLATIETNGEGVEALPGGGLTPVPADD
jgi:ATP-binding cassette subfamily B protein